MRKLIHLSLVVGLATTIFSACSSTRGVTTAGSTVSRSDIIGDWTVTSVNLEGFPAGYSVGRVFDLADYQDLQGSTWDLNGNGFGTVSLTNGTSQQIYWSLNRTGGAQNLQFKKVTDGQRPRDVDTGYMVQFGDVNQSTAVIRSPVTLSSGQTAYVNLNLSKQ